MARPEDQNGIRIPLLIDTGLFLLGLIIATAMYTDLNRLKADQIPESRIVRVEEKLTALKETLEDQKKALEDMKRQQAEQAKKQEEQTQRILDAVRAKGR